MPLTINDLPYEILSQILEAAAEHNVLQGPLYTYGLSQAPEPLKDAQLHPVIRGQLSPDTLRFNSTESLRQVARRWHDWAAEYALETLYISRWRGSERYSLTLNPTVLPPLTNFIRWMQSRTLDSVHSQPSSIAVYRDPYHSLRKTMQLFEANSSLASCVRRIWFDGYYGAETNTMIFRILNRCSNLDCLTLPWTALRYGNENDWSRLLGRNYQNRSISSLELLAVDLKHSQISNTSNRVDKKPLNSPQVNFRGLKRLKIFGHSNFMPLMDEDLIAISHTACNLREIHITGTASVTINGIKALAHSSAESLEVVEHSPLAADGFAHPDLTLFHKQKDHLCQKIVQCPRLQSLSLTVPSLCGDLFANTLVNWHGEVQIRTLTICGRLPSFLKHSPYAQTEFWRILDSARFLIAMREKEGVELNIEIFVDNWIFEPRCFLVHGDFGSRVIASQGLWLPERCHSSKGPYGQTGLYGKDDSPYESISEANFIGGLEKRYVQF